MTRSQIESAIPNGVPFLLRTADGRAYSVPHWDYTSVSLQGTFATMWNDEDGFFVLPLPAKTGLVSQGVMGDQPVAG